MAFSFAFFVYVVSTPVETLETMCETWRRHTEELATVAHRHRHQYHTATEAVAVVSK